MGIGADNGKEPLSPRFGARYIREKGVLPGRRIMSKSPSAGKAADKQVKQMLLDMAAMEDGHLVTFQQMREELSDKMRAIFKSLK